MPLTAMLDYLHLQKLLTAQLQNWKFKKQFQIKSTKKNKKKQILSHKMKRETNSTHILHILMIIDLIY